MRNTHHGQYLQASAFHTACDGASPSLVLVRADSGHIAGGFTDVPWSSSPAGKGRYVSSDRSFLFSLHAPSGEATSLPFTIIWFDFLLCTSNCFKISQVRMFPSLTSGSGCSPCLTTLAAAPYSGRGLTSSSVTGVTPRPRVTPTSRTGERTEQPIRALTQD